MLSLLYRLFTIYQWLTLVDNSAILPSVRKQAHKAHRNDHTAAQRYRSHRSRPRSPALPGGSGRTRAGRAGRGERVVCGAGQARSRINGRSQGDGRSVPRQQEEQLTMTTLTQLPRESFVTAAFAELLSDVGNLLTAAQ